MRKVARSSTSPSTSVRSTAERTSRSASAGASCPRARDSTFAAIPSKASASSAAREDRRCAAAACREIARGGDGLRDEIAFGDDIDDPSAFASAAPTMRPVAAISAAATTPASRGRRCVPPAPGTMPSFTSGRPSFAACAAMRWWQPSAISSPPPSAAPLIAATTGFSLASMWLISCGSSGSAIGLPNSRMSAPPTKVLPAPVIDDADDVVQSPPHGRSPRTDPAACRPRLRSPVGCRSSRPARRR